MRLPGTGAFTVSLDFELHWGMRHLLPVDAAYGSVILGARKAIPMMLDLFAKYGIAATWGTVGMLFAESKEELLSYVPENKPDYADRISNPYLEDIGAGEKEDPYHYAPSLIELIASYPRQEIASHTFSHFYVLEEGHHVAAFRSDMESSLAIARAHGYDLRSLIFPRGTPTDNKYLRVLPGLGIERYRSANFLHRRNHFAPIDQTIRVLRFADSCTGITSYSTFPWKEVRMNEAGGLVQVPGSMFLRARPFNSPLYNRLHLARIRSCMRDAARRRRVFHIWWHPQNFGADPDWSIRMLEGLLEYFRKLQDAFGFESLNMVEACQTVRSPEVE
jgi:peptidoglycan/xylan/chitin deacetylase (PgdA/CDA1 family)